MNATTESEKQQDRREKEREMTEVESIYNERFSHFLMKMLTESQPMIDHLS